jgi:hypothetical protein
MTRSGALKTVLKVGPFRPLGQEMAKPNTADKPCSFDIVQFDLTLQSISR